MTDHKHSESPALPGATARERQAAARKAWAAHMQETRLEDPDAGRTVTLRAETRWPLLKWLNRLGIPSIPHRRR